MCCGNKEINCCGDYKDEGKRLGNDGSEPTILFDIVNKGEEKLNLPEEEPRHGHPRFYELLEEIGQLHNDKNHDYAKGGDPLGNFKRRATLYGLYPGLDLSDPAVIALVDMMKQLDALLWFCSNKHEAKVEGKVGRAKDISVYSLINTILEEEKK